MSCDWIVDGLSCVIDNMNECRDLNDGLVEGFSWRIELMWSDLLVKEAVSGSLTPAELNATYIKS